MDRELFFPPSSAVNSVSKSQCLISLSEQGMTLKDLSLLTQF